MTLYVSSVYGLRVKGNLMELVEFVRLRAGEEPFSMGGTKWQYVTCRNERGDLDIGVYSFSGDLTYSYRSFRQAFNLQ